MAQGLSGEYLKNAVMTASPEQLQLMLYDGAIRFARQARGAIERKAFDDACEKLIRAQRIVAEMQNGLQRDVNPTLCEQLGQLYQFVYNRLVEANLKHDTAAIDEALTILEHQRETWLLLMERIKSAEAGPPSTERSHAAETPATLCVEG